MAVSLQSRAPPPQPLAGAKTKRICMHSREPAPPLPLDHRLRAANGGAAALAYKFHLPAAACQATGARVSGWLADTSLILGGLVG